MSPVSKKSSAPKNCKERKRKGERERDTFTKIIHMRDFYYTKIIHMRDFY